MMAIEPYKGLILQSWSHMISVSYPLKGHTHLATLVWLPVQSAVCTGNSSADHPVGIAYLLGNWATDHWATTVAGQLDYCRLISSMFDISLPTDRPATAVAWRSVAQG